MLYWCTEPVISHLYDSVRSGKVEVVHLVVVGLVYHPDPQVQVRLDLLITATDSNVIKPSQSILKYVRRINVILKNLLFLPIKEHRRYLRSEEVEEVFLGQTQLLQSPAVGGREGGVQLPAPDMIIIITLIIITVTVIT